MKMKGWNLWTMLVIIALVAMIAPNTHAGALTAERSTPERTGENLAVAVASSTTIYAGAMVAINSGGYAVPASDTAGLKVLGRAERTVVNAGGNGAAVIIVRRGVFRWANGDTFTLADVGALAYVEDDQTVQKAASATHDIPAGTILAVDADGVWVDTFSLPSHGSATVVNLTATGNAAVTGNATVGGTLGVTGVATFTAAPTLTAVTSAGSETATLTNAPAAGNPLAWANVSIGANTYVIPLFAAE